MGYRSTFITNAGYFKFPEWFVKKYKEGFNFYKSDMTPINSKDEYKRYDCEDFEKDIVRCLIESSKPHETIHGVWLDENGVITKVTFTDSGVEELYEYDMYSVEEKRINWQEFGFEGGNCISSAEEWDKFKREQIDICDFKKAIRIGDIIIKDVGVPYFCFPADAEGRKSKETLIKFFKRYNMEI